MNRLIRRFWESTTARFRQLGEEALSVFCREPEKARKVFLGIDKSGRERELDGWEKKDAGSFRKRLLEDVNRGIGEILRESETLSSFERQEAFLFAHPALRRGCGSGNLFVICCLDSGVPEASLRKRQPADSGCQRIRRGISFPVMRQRVSG